MKKNFPQRISKLIFLCLSFGVIIYVLIGNFAPFGITEAYSKIDLKNITALVPGDRVSAFQENNETLYKQTSDLIYFSTNMPFKFDTAKMKVTFKNINEEQQLLVGYQDQVQWHYESKLIDAPFMDLQSWSRTGTNSMLYQKINSYNSVEDFLGNPPKGKTIGSFNFDTNTLGLSKVSISNYQPKTTDTLITTPLRGKHIIYAYLKNERYKMTITKQDLNIYDDPDPVTITIYKDKDIVYKLTAEDDGVSDTSGKVFPAQEIYIENPEAEFPEEGVYKIVIDTTQDVVIKSIKTNFHKIVFEGPIYPIENNEVFPRIAEKTVPTKLFTNAKSITARTFHNPALQEIKVASESADILASPIPTPKARNNQPVASDSASFKIDTLHQDVTVPLEYPISQILFPKSDVMVNGFLGYFAFEKDQLFYPTAYSVLPITKKEDIEKVDYILTDYSSPTIDGEWKVAEVGFDLSNAVIKNGKLSWLIRAPGLKENGREIIIKNIEVELTKKPLIKL